MLGGMQMGSVCSCAQAPVDGRSGRPGIAKAAAGHAVAWVQHPGMLMPAPLIHGLLSGTQARAREQGGREGGAGTDLNAALEWYPRVRRRSCVALPKCPALASRD